MINNITLAWSSTHQAHKWCQSITVQTLASDLVQALSWSSPVFIYLVIIQIIHCACPGDM